ncbi:MAG TPA: hypothetical protein VHV82_17105 [Sporichthyaceae bacterium]|jgi:hypothetical protein|nr:hypothetical protein [Sporichthyaceae bacterium]
MGGRVKPHTLLLGVAAALVCVRAATPASGTSATFTSAVDTEALSSAVPVMVSISGPLDVHMPQPASVGTAVHLAADGEAIDGATVLLDRRVGDKAPWVEVARAVTDSKGRALFVVPVASPTTQFRAVCLPDPHFAAASSAVITVATR